MVGFRVWYALGKPWQRPPTDDGRLKSIGQQFVWTSAAVQAHCRRRDHPAPALGCECGLYAYDRLATAALYERHVNSAINQNFSAVIVLGVVLLWGHLIYGEVADHYPSSPPGSDLGLRFRAQFGRVLALRDDGEANAFACRAYGVPAIREHYLESFAKEHGDRLSPPPPDLITAYYSSGRRRHERLLNAYRTLGY